MKMFGVNNLSLISSYHLMQNCFKPIFEQKFLVHPACILGTMTMTTFVSMKESPELCPLWLRLQFECKCIKFQTIWNHWVKIIYLSYNTRQKRQSQECKNSWAGPDRNKSGSRSRKFLILNSFSSIQIQSCSCQNLTAMNKLLRQSRRNPRLQKKRTNHSESQEDTITKMNYFTNKRKRGILRVGKILAVGHLQFKSGMSATLFGPFTGPYHGM